MGDNRQLIKPLCAAILLATGSVQAAGFGVTTQSGTGGGNSATGHAMAEDASAMWYNPALLHSMQGRQVNTGISLLSTDITLENAGSSIHFFSKDNGNFITENISNYAAKARCNCS